MAETQNQEAEIEIENENDTANKRSYCTLGR
jgi:hypothetical protein